MSAREGASAKSLTISRARTREAKPETVQSDPRGSTPAGQWRSRIVGHRDVAPAELAANDQNWRQHPRAQRRALTEALSRVGFVQGVVYNVRTQRIVDGHLRVEEALRTEQPTVPVTDVDLSEDEERLVLATFDPLGDMAEADMDALRVLLADVDDMGADLMAMFADLPLEIPDVPLLDMGQGDTPAAGDVRVAVSVPGALAVERRAELSAAFDALRATGATVDGWT